MRIVIAIAALLSAVFMAVTWYQPVCEGGRVVASEGECRAVPIFDAAFCRKAWALTDGIARRSGMSYPTRTECDDSWPVCIEHEPGGYGPKPAGWCLVRGPNGEAARIDPQYERKRG